MSANPEATSPAPATAAAPASKPRRLVVLVPGLSGRLGPWAELKGRLAQEAGFGPDEAAWLDFDEFTHVWSVGPLAALAGRLRARVDAEWAKHDGFEDVVLVGHSMGGLVVRQAYLLAAGAVPGEPASDWGRRVSRIVLFAALNRGVDPSRAPFGAFLAWLARVLPFVPHFRTMDAVRGSDFLTNLRINWVRHFGTLAARGAGRPPRVVQLLGDEDGLVSPADSKDVLAFPSGHDLTVPDANHRDLYRLDQARDPEGRYAILRRAFVEEFADKPPKPSPVRRVVFLLHGIRASNVDEWIEGLEQLIKKRDGEHTVVKHPTYGYFTAARFALPSVRRKNIAQFQDWYTEALAEHPTAEFDIIAHSNGTYILGQSLRHTPGMRFENVALAGSVLPTRFPWAALKGQVGRVRNDRADRDWPVALLCNALRGLFMRDVGTGGFAGFDGGATIEVAYYSGDHGEALRPAYQQSLVDFIFGGDVVKPPTLVHSPGYYRQLSNAMPYLALPAAAGAAALLGWFVWQGWDFHPYRLFGSALALLVAYVLLDII
jgi:alpha-beta hydrolase superfamily lysophospholipase